MNRINIRVEIYACIDDDAISGRSRAPVWFAAPRRTISTRSGEPLLIERVVKCFQYQFRTSVGNPFSMKTSVCGFICFALVASIACAGEWRQFRGPDGQGRADAKNLPVTWSETENVIWKTAVPGRGWSSPVYAEGKIWLTTGVEKSLTPEALEQQKLTKLAFNPMAKEMSLVESVSLHAVSLDAETGKLLSNTELFTVKEPPGIHTLNSFASPTPVLDGHLLLCHFGELGTACLDTSSLQILWTTVLPGAHAVGAGSSPIVYGDLLIIPCDGTDRQYVVALNKLTGKEVWKTKRPRMTGFLGDFHKAFSSPLVVNYQGRDQIVIPAAQWFASYDPLTGKELWRFRHGEGFSNSSCPVSDGNLVCITSGVSKTQLFAIRLDGSGDITKTHSAWKISKQVPVISSPVIVGHEIYYVNDQGIASAANLSDGAVLWTKRIGGNHSASPLAADGKIYFSSQEGKTTVIAAGSEYRELAVNTLEGQLLASPVVLDESLLLRTQSHLYRIGAKADKKSAEK
ncbi:MAG: serine/threonine protein kinase afsK [Planctomycetaceae bacterium]|nr:serine/threonine protein kinase afsK [Planctomycetaceae bacterium]